MNLILFPFENWKFASVRLHPVNVHTYIYNAYEIYVYPFILCVFSFLWEFFSTHIDTSPALDEVP